MEEGIRARAEGRPAHWPGICPGRFYLGFLAVSGGLPVWVACLISFSNLTSAGQFAGMNLIFAGSGYFEVALTTFVINLRYMLMSLVPDPEDRTVHGNHKTDACRLRGDGRDLCRRFAESWDAEGALLVWAGSRSPLPDGIWEPLWERRYRIFCRWRFKTPMGIALYGMFIALIVPASRESVSILIIVLIAVAVNCALQFIPAFPLFPPASGLFWLHLPEPALEPSCSRRKKRIM